MLHDTDYKYPDSIAEHLRAGGTFEDWPEQPILGWLAETFVYERAICGGHQGLVDLMNVRNSTGALRGVHPEPISRLERFADDIEKIRQEMGDERAESFGADCDLEDLNEGYFVELLADEGLADLAVSLLPAEHVASYSADIASAHHPFALQPVIRWGYKCQLSGEIRDGAALMLVAVGRRADDLSDNFGGEVLFSTAAVRAALGDA